MSVIQEFRSSLVQMMTCHLFCTKSLPNSMLTYCQLDFLEPNFIEILVEIQTFSFKKMHLKKSSAIG